MKILIQDRKEVFSVEVDPSETIRAIKKEIAKLKNCKIVQVRLVYNGKVLNGKHLISSIGYNPEKRIEVDIDQTYVPKRAPVSQEVLDQQFLTAISKPPVSGKLQDPNVRSLIFDLMSAVAELAAVAPDYEGVVNRILMAIDYEPDYAEMYKNQIDEMREMQLGSDEDYLKALIATGGNVDESVEWLIENGVIQ